MKEGISSIRRKGNKKKLIKMQMQIRNKRGQGKRKRELCMKSNNQKVKMIMINNITKKKKMTEPTKNKNASKFFKTSILHSKKATSP